MILWIFALILACGGRSDRVVVVGMDGLDPTHVDTMISAGVLPNFQRMTEEGIKTGLTVPVKPIWSPVLWTGMVTLVEPELHGITHWSRPQGDLYWSNHIRSKTIWDVATEQNSKTYSPEFEIAKKSCLRAFCEESMGMSLKESLFYGDFENKQQEK